MNLAFPVNLPETDEKLIKISPNFLIFSSQYMVSCLNCTTFSEILVQASTETFWQLNEQQDHGCNSIHPSQSPPLLSNSCRVHSKVHYFCPVDHMIQTHSTVVANLHLGVRSWTSGAHSITHKFLLI